MILSKENDFVTNNSVIRKNQERRTKNHERRAYSDVSPSDAKETRDMLLKWIKADNSEDS